MATNSLLDHMPLAQMPFDAYLNKPQIMPTPAEVETRITKELKIVEPSVKVQINKDLLEQWHSKKEMEEMQLKNAKAMEYKADGTAKMRSAAVGPIVDITV